VLFNLIAIGVLAATVVLALGTMWLLDSGRSHIVRAFALTADIVLVAAGVALAREQHGEGPDLAYFLLAFLFLGAVLHGIGVIAWDRAFAWVARGLGFMLVAAPIVIPSVLTLALPLLPILALTLRTSRFPRTRLRLEATRPSSG